jgi:glutaredoxin
MNRYSISIATLLLLTSGYTAAQQMYKWVGADGKINYSDAPPPASAKRLETKATASAGADTSNLPYELAQSVKSNPVTLFTSANCSPCDSARRLLSVRGIPFTEKTVSTNEDALRLKQLASTDQLPVLLVGRTTQTGFEAGAWGTALTAAGYPQSSRLPPSYRNPLAVPAAPQVASVNKPTIAEKAVSDTRAKPAAPVNNPTPGFRF